MSDDNDDDLKDTMYPFKSNPLWKDITPIQQNDGPDPVVPIQYTPQFVETMDYFRAIMKKDEKSERALSLTKEVIAHNAANYTAWHYRRLCLFALRSDLNIELKWCEKFAIQNAKNYQLWHHRRLLMEKVRKVGNELEHTDEVLQLDHKNYHAWSHRQWVLKTFNCFDNELKFVESLLDKDIRNNSAWNQRHFVIANTSGFTSSAIQPEIRYACRQLRLAPHNESAWNYLIGMLNKPAFSSSDELEKFALDILRENPKCDGAQMMLVELYEKDGRSGDAAKYCDILAATTDTTRSSYWLFRKTQLPTNSKKPASFK